MDPRGHGGHHDDRNPAPAGSGHPHGSLFRVQFQCGHLHHRGDHHRGRAGQNRVDQPGGFAGGQAGRKQLFPADCGHGHHRGHHFQLHAEHRRGRIVSAGHSPGEQKPEHFPLANADAHRLLRHPGRHINPCRVQPSDPAQRSAHSLWPGTISAFRRDPYRAGPGGRRIGHIRAFWPFHPAQGRCAQGRRRPLRGKGNTSSRRPGL